MDVFEVHEHLIEDYKAFTSGAVAIRDDRVRDHLDRELAEGVQWPDPWLSLNPSFATGGSVSDAVREGALHPECERIFRVKKDQLDPGTRGLTLHRHQRDAVDIARSGKSYVLTTGTGSGKSLAYIIPIVDHVLRQRASSSSVRGVKAIVVYPMNALANSQQGELEKFLRYGYPEGGEPVTFARYTGQEGTDERRQILADPPDILLTNYMMLELVLTRPDERKHLIRAAPGLRFLVLDELHTYRGRQGADVAMLVRRLQDACASDDLQVIGTSATMASGGTAAEQKRIVADVASRLFGSEVTAERVIGETLERATLDPTVEPDELATAVAATEGRAGPRGYADVAADALARWVESTFGLDVEKSTGALVRRKPTTVPQAATTLAHLTGHADDRCRAAIRAALMEGSRATNPGTNRPLFAFRLHQFLSKGDTVHASLEPEATRHLTSTYQLRVPGEAEKVLLPLGFCRECGQEYVVVARSRRQGRTVYLPRKDADASGGDSVTGYLYHSSDLPWPVDPVAEGRLPDHWLTTVDSGEQVVVSQKEKYLPQPVWLAPDGTEAVPGAGLPAWFLPTPFAFCLRCRVSYEQVRGQDFAKLATLDQEGRSSAVTVVSSSIVRSLRSLPTHELGADARKLLTFVDNRQDASLQAGHFNDFVQVTQLRGGLINALSSSGGGLTHESVTQHVTAALGLSVGDFAQNPQAKFSARDQAERALRALVEYRLYSDLQRGWRVTMPNLEQTGLLRVGYRDLPEIARDRDSWQKAHPAITGADPSLLEELCRILLDELRRVRAVDVECLTDHGFEQLQRESRQHLTGPWSLGESELLVPVGVAYPRPGGSGGFRNDLNVSGRSAFGKYLRRGDGGLGPSLTADDAQEVIADLLRVLAECGLLTVVADAGVPGYRLKASGLHWLAGDGTRGAEDPLRKAMDSESAARVNPFFVTLYREVAGTLAGLQAKEHTAQVPGVERERREQAFRDGTLPLLYCSPTMELGVDIASLNAVAMRNVPPTPANYAQRSGRAGRSGQPALVVTYCATGNAHDTYYFRNSREMVAGSVAAPRLDLANEDLVRSHVHAIWLAETDQSLKTRITDLVEADGERPSLRVIPDIWRALTEPAVHRRATHRAEDAITSLRQTWGLTHDLVTWWYEGWVADQVAAAPKRFDNSLDRWRSLYQEAVLEYRTQNDVAIDPRAPQGARKAATGRAADARNQLRLLRNEDSELGQTDFYTYRYLASEGFLPGYSFPRLPLAAYIPGMRSYGRSGDGDYVQRPRFLAISEFGPGALIYHEGARYEVVRVQVPRQVDQQAGGANSIDTEEARRCDACGYHHPVAVGTDVCDACGSRLGGKTYGLLKLQTVFTRRRERISSDEEERRRSGFELEVSYRYTDSGERAGHVDAVASGPAGAVAELRYGDSATIRVSNVGRRRRKDDADRGFWLDAMTGRWLSDKKATDATVDADGLESSDDVVRKHKVIPYVEDRRNILVLRLSRAVSDVEATTLRYALERGIEATFQLEDSELDSQELPDLEGRGRMLLTESAEGGAGVLRRLVTEPSALAKVAREALRIAHFDPDGGTDVDHAPGAAERCEMACYECLLSYGNQHFHSSIDRHAISDVLMALSGSSTVSGAGGRTRGDQRDHLDDLADSSLEKDFIGWLEEKGLRLPDRAQVTITSALARPDLVYDLPSGSVAVFVDGPVHDAPHVAQRDEAAQERLEDEGWTVVRFHHGGDWAAVVSQLPSVFGAVAE